MFFEGGGEAWVKRVLESSGLNAGLLMLLSGYEKSRYKAAIAVTARAHCKEHIADSDKVTVTSNDTEGLLDPGQVVLRY